VELLTPPPILGHIPVYGASDRATSVRLEQCGTQDVEFVWSCWIPRAAASHRLEALVHFSSTKKPISGLTARPVQARLAAHGFLV
jgi:hypothetical protein